MKLNYIILFRILKTIVLVCGCGKINDNSLETIKAREEIEDTDQRIKVENTENRSTSSDDFSSSSSSDITINYNNKTPSTSLEIIQESPKIEILKDEGEINNLTNKVAEKKENNDRLKSKIKNLLNPKKNKPNTFLQEETRFSSNYIEDTIENQNQTSNLQPQKKTIGKFDSEKEHNSTIISKIQKKLKDTKEKLTKKENKPISIAILVHGLNSSHKAMQILEKELKKRDIHVLNTRNREKDKTHESIDNQVKILKKEIDDYLETRQLKHLINKNGCINFKIIGHSQGGCIIYDYLNKYGENLNNKYKRFKIHGYCLASPVAGVEHNNSYIGKVAKDLDDLKRKILNYNNFIKIIGKIRSLEKYCDMRIENFKKYAHIETTNLKGLKDLSKESRSTQNVSSLKFPITYFTASCDMETFLKNDINYKLSKKNSALLSGHINSLFENNDIKTIIKNLDKDMRGLLCNEINDGIVSLSSQSIDPFNTIHILCASHRSILKSSIVIDEISKIS